MLLPKDSIIMRCSFAFLATIYAATVCTVASDLVDAGEKTRVDVTATGYDTRTSGHGCSPNGCVPENTRDGTRRSNSRWSCKGDILDSSVADEGCCIMYSFEEPQDINNMYIAFHKGDENTRTLDVFDNGDPHSTFTSSGTTLSIHGWNLYTQDTEEIKLCLDDPASNADVWLSITEVKFWVEE